MMRSKVVVGFLPATWRGVTIPTKRPVAVTMGSAKSLCSPRKAVKSATVADGWALMVSASGV